MASGIICQACGIEAPTKYVEFHQNIGAMLMRFSKAMKGNLCKRCIHQYFWKFTATNLTLGWWGTISLFIAPIFTINNVVKYIGALGLEPVPPGAKAPVLTPEATMKINPLASQLIARLNANEPLADVARDIARRTGVTPGQVVLFLAQRAGQRPPGVPRAAGFPVLPPKPKPADLAPIPLEPDENADGTRTDQRRP